MEVGALEMTSLDHCTEACCGQFYGRYLRYEVRVGVLRSVRNIKLQRGTRSSRLHMSKDLGANIFCFEGEGVGGAENTDEIVCLSIDVTCSCKSEQVAWDYFSDTGH